MLVMTVIAFQCKGTSTLEHFGVFESHKGVYPNRMIVYGANSYAKHCPPTSGCSAQAMLMTMESTVPMMFLALESLQES